MTKQYTKKQNEEEINRKITNTSRTYMLMGGRLKFLHHQMIVVRLVLVISKDFVNHARSSFIITNM